MWNKITAYQFAGLIEYFTFEYEVLGIGPFKKTSSQKAEKNYLEQIRILYIFVQVS
jgi:hypothetical protein